MGDNRRHPIGACITIRTSRLRLTGRRAAVRVAYERVFDISSCAADSDGPVGVPAAILCAEPRCLVDLSRSQDKINTVGIRRVDGGHDRLYARVGESGSL